MIGLTATPFRMKSGMICEPENVLNHVCYEIGVKELIVQGYLCPLVTKGSAQPIDTSGLHVRAGEFVAGEAEDLMDTDELVESACREIVEQTQERRSVLVFTTGVRHGEHVAAVLRRMAGEPVATVFGETADAERDRVLADFKAGAIKYLVNVNVLTMGFDAPNIDCVAMVRPTLSPGLYYQMVGRGFRLHPGKENCLVLDFGGNVLRHGPVDAIRIQTVNHREERRGAGQAVPGVPEPDRRRLRGVPGLRLRVPAARAAEPRGDRLDRGDPLGRGHDHRPPGPGRLLHRPPQARRARRCPQDAAGRVPDRVPPVPVGVDLLRAHGLGPPQGRVVVAAAVAGSGPGLGRGGGGARPRTARSARRARSRCAAWSGEEYPRIIGYDLGPKPAWREPGMDDEVGDVGLRLRRRR